MSRRLRLAARVAMSGQLFWNDPEDSDSDMVQEAHDLAKRAGLNILSDKDLRAYIMDDTEMMGALFVGFTAGKYSFDVAVDPHYQGQGVGSYLTNLGISQFEEYDEVGEMEIDAVNPQMASMLETRGFYKVSEQGSHTIMRKA